MSRTTHTVLCGGTRPAGVNDRDVVSLDLHGANANVFLKIGDITDAMAKNVPDVLVDILNVATYVFSADQAIGRGGARDTGGRWRRTLRFHVPVRCPDIWTTGDVTGALQDVLGFLSDDDYEFTFTELQETQPVQLYIDGLVLSMDAEEVLLFSGGVDSLAGAVQAALCNKRRVALVSHRSAPKRAPQVTQLAEEIARRAPGLVQHIPVWATKAEKVGREYTQRTRSFLYASLATAVAQMLDIDTIRFYENGVTSLNLPVAPQVVGGRATRTTHPQSLNGFAKLFSLLLDKPFKVESPFQWLTKGEVFQIIKDNGCGDLIPHTVSCSRTVEATKLHTHCGRCSQCVDRRFAALGVGLTDDEDPAEMYKVQLMTDERVVGESRTMAETFLRRALALRAMNPLDFIRTYTEATRVLRHVGLTADEAATRVHDLHRRHGEEVQAALTEGHKRHAAEFQSGALPDSCVLVLAVPDRYRQQGADKKVPTFRLNGDHWEVWFENEKTSLKDTKGLGHIAKLLANPGQQIHAIDMLLADAPAPVQGMRTSGGSPGDTTEDGLRVRRSPSGTGGKATDRLAVRRYRSRLDEIEDELAVARDSGNPESLLELQEEQTRLVSHIGSVVDLRGNPRPSADDDERARQTVTKAIGRAMTKLWKKHPGLARHLGTHLTKGVQSVYAPDPQVTWLTQ